jgi:protease-4
MKKKWILVAVVLCLVVSVIFVVSVFLVRAVVGDRSGIGVGPGIGLVEVKGPILDSQETVRQLVDFGDSNMVKAVALRIDSPGGVVGPSQEICAEVKKLAQKKKVIVSMGSVAASGGYYIAAPATKIFANPGTITGSIGVLMKLSNFEGLMGKIGMKATTLKSGHFKDAGSPTRTMTKEEQAVLQGVIDNLHGQFVRAVAEGRKLPVEDVRKLADGRVYTGEQAIALKLVDKIGTLEDACNEAGRLVGIHGEPRIIRPPKKRRVLSDMLAEEASSFLETVAGKEDAWSIRYQMPFSGGE